MINMRGIFGEYGIYIVELIMGSTAFGLIVLTLGKLQPVVEEGLIRLMGG
ncbi:MAG: hypothetical protein ACI4LC_04930 [Emergencia sp.]